MVVVVVVVVVVVRTCSQFVQARAITDRDEKSLASQLEQLEKQAQEELEAEFD